MFAAPGEEKTQLQVELADAMVALSEVLVRGGNPAEAELLIRKQLRLLEAVLPPQHPDVSRCVTLSTQSQRLHRYT